MKQSFIYGVAHLTLIVGLLTPTMAFSDQVPPAAFVRSDVNSDLRLEGSGQGTKHEGLGGHQPTRASGSSGVHRVTLYPIAFEGAPWAAGANYLTAATNDGHLWNLVRSVPSSFYLKSDDVQKRRRAK